MDGVYADSLLVTATSTALVNTYFEGLSSLEIKDLVVVSKFLGLRISLDNEDLYKLDQEVEIYLLIKDFGLEKANG